MKLVPHTTHKVAFEFNDHTKVLYEVDPAEPFTAMHLKTTVMPMVRDTAAVVQALEGNTGYKYLVTLELIMADITHAITTALKSAPLSTFPNDPTEEQLHRMFMQEAEALGCDNLVVKLKGMLESAKEMADDILAAKVTEKKAKRDGTLNLIVMYLCLYCVCTVQRKCTWM